MFNQVIIAGRLAHNPELIVEEGSNNKRTRVVLAVQRPFKSKGSQDYETDFIPVTMWEGIAESVAQYCKKGSPIIVRGRLEQNTYIDKEMGKKIYSLNIIGEKVIFLGSQQKDDKEAERPSE